MLVEDEPTIVSVEGEMRGVNYSAFPTPFHLGRVCHELHVGPAPFLPDDQLETRPPAPDCFVTERAPAQRARRAGRDPAFNLRGGSVRKVTAEDAEPALAFVESRVLWYPWASGLTWAAPR